MSSGDWKPPGGAEERGTSAERQNFILEHCLLFCGSVYGIRFAKKTNGKRMGMGEETAEEMTGSSINPMIEHMFSAV